MGTYDKTKRAYDEIFALMDKHKDDLVFRVDSFKDKAEHHLYGIELVEKYGFQINPKEIHDKVWQALSDHIYIGFMDGTRRTISAPDDGRQPYNEQMLIIKFPSGAYVLDASYPTIIFREFFNELKTFNPKYTDTRNSNLYFDLDNGAKVFNAFRSILDKHKTRARQYAAQEKIEMLKRELAELEGK
jgi:hypothetical protein